MADLNGKTMTPEEKRRLFLAVGIEGVFVMAAFGIYVTTGNLTVLIAMLGVSSVGMTLFMLWNIQKARRDRKSRRMVE